MAKRPADGEAGMGPCRHHGAERFTSGLGPRLSPMGTALGTAVTPPKAVGNALGWLLTGPFHADIYNLPWRGRGLSASFCLFFNISCFQKQARVYWEPPTCQALYEARVYLHVTIFIQQSNTGVEPKAPSPSSLSGCS